MSGSIGLGISFIFHDVDTDFSLCSKCREVIVTRIHKLYLSIDTRLSESGFELGETNCQFCQSCHDTMEIENDHI